MNVIFSGPQWDSHEHKNKHFNEKLKLSLTLQIKSMKMKSKDGKLILEEGDIQVGNFIFSQDDNFIYLQDINEAAFFKLRKMSSTAAQYIEILLKDEKKNETALGLEAATAYLYLTTVKDSQCIEKIINSLAECINRHKDLFNIRENISEEENKQIINDQKDFYSAVEKLSEP